MKLIKLLLVIAAAAAMTLALGGNALAFHGQGVAYCSGCHTMHNSQDGAAVAPEGATGDYLLRQTDGSSACLRCHAEYGQRTETGSGYGAAGDFYWLTKDYTWDSHGPQESTGDSHGHNIIAEDFGLLDPDGVLLKAPGGSFNHEMSCASCHDPHGNDNYNLLRGLESHDGANFPEAPIVRKTYRISNYLNERGRPETDTDHVVYGSGMSKWCAACHTDFLSAARMHPADESMNSTIRDNYNAYISTDNPTGGSSTTAYTTLVPFQTGATDIDLLPPNNSTEGPVSGAQVACISCHRAHASAFPDIGRWFFDTEDLTSDSHPKVGDSGLGPDDVVNSYYGRSIAERFPAAEQRSLCNKCHVKDLNSGSHGG